ncbi:MAG: M23 family metallopeptidase [Chitinophagaceae bacterium]|nr:M23 family metallopeptidase [Chitinophagaceae bacterium]
MANHRFSNPAFLLILLLSTGCAINKDPYQTKLKLLQKGKVKDDTSFVYQLPFENNTSKLIVQGYFSSFSHRNRAALDFKMKRGTKIHAARGGVVVRVKEDGDKGGWNRKYRPQGNMIVIQHEDGSRAGYWHLQFDGSLVKTGDTVQQGQVIGLSGKTGYTLFPHLHFLVWTSQKGNWQQVATRFRTSKGIRFLRPFRKYKRVD